MDWCSHFSFLGAHSSLARSSRSWVVVREMHKMHTPPPPALHLSSQLRSTLSKCFSVPSTKIDIWRVDKFYDPEKIVDQHCWWRVRAKSHQAVNELHLSGKINKTIFRTGNILTVGLKNCSSIIITNCLHPGPPCNYFSANLMAINSSFFFFWRSNG